LPFGQQYRPFTLLAAARRGTSSFGVLLSTRIGFAFYDSYTPQPKPSEQDFQRRPQPDNRWRLIEGMPSRAVKTDRSDDKPMVSKFDLATLVYTIDTWSMEMVQAYNPVTDQRAVMYLQMHLPGAIEKLITLAEANGLAGDVLDMYVTRRFEAAQRITAESEAIEGVFEDADDEEEPEKPEAAEPASAEQQDGISDDELRDLTETKVGRMPRAKAAKEIGIAPSTLVSFLNGGKPHGTTQEKLQAWLNA
jgi:hypothetical protein